MANTVTYESGPLDTDELQDFAEGMRLPLDASGATSVNYKLYAEGRFHFLKVLRREYLDNPFYHELFRKEHEVGIKLEHACFPKYEKLTLTDDEVSLQMEFVDGETLESFISNNPTYFLKESNVERFLVQLLSGLEYLHGMQTVHLDIKPSNIIITRVDMSVRIVDLGFCHTDSMPFTEGCTTEYAAPEQKKAGEKVDARTDIYAVGLLLRYINEYAKLPKRFVKIMKRAVQESPELRYQSAKDMMKAVAPRRSDKTLYTIAAFATALLALATVLFFHLKDDANEGDDLFEKYYHDQNITFRILDKDSLTVEIVSDKSTISMHTDYSLPSEIEHDGKIYTVVSLGDSLFMYNNGIRRVALPTSLEKIGNSAFAFCKKLQIISMPNSVKKIDEDCFTNCTSLISISLSSNLKEIPRTAFVNDSLLTSIIIPEGVTHISQDAFTSCASLSNVVLPSTLESIDRGVFFNCISLRSITIPEKVNSLGEYAFHGCNNLDTIVCLPATPPRGAAFVPKAYKGVIIVPSDAVEAYRSNPVWGQFTIVGRENKWR